MPSEIQGRGRGNRCTTLREMGMKQIIKSTRRTRLATILSFMCVCVQAVRCSRKVALKYATPRRARRWLGFGHKGDGMAMVSQHIKYEKGTIPCLPVVRYMIREYERLKK